MGQSRTFLAKSIPPLPALRLRLSFLPAPDPDPDHEEDDTNYKWQNCADRGASPNRRAAPDGVMVGEGRGGGDQDYAGVDHQSVDDLAGLAVAAVRAKTGESGGARTAARQWPEPEGGGPGASNEHSTFTGSEFCQPCRTGCAEVLCIRGRIRPFSRVRRRVPSRRRGPRKSTSGTAYRSRLEAFSAAGSRSP